MTSSGTCLAERIEIEQRFLRSINVETDYQRNYQNGNYIITATARQILRRISEGLNVNSTSRSWTITGPYGVGKSAFAVFLIKVLCSGVAGNKKARINLEQADRSLAKELLGNINTGKGFLPVAITSRRAPASLCFTEGILSCASQIKGLQAKRLARECRSLLADLSDGIPADTRKIVSMMDSLATIARNERYAGLLFVVDELGKLFEFAARMPQKADVFVLQELAEKASRSGEFPCLFLGFLHQSFEEYGQHLDNLTRKEWAKIHGRFEDIVFLEPADQVIRMISTAIKWIGPKLPDDLIRKIKHLAGVCADNGICPPGMRGNEFEEICLRTYPIHPVALAALPFIFRRFSQNERSLFSYLSSLEPYGFQEYLRTHILSDESSEFLRLYDLFDYFTTNFGTGLFRQPQARRWMEAADMLDRKDDLSSLHRQLIKTIGVLGALGEISHLSSTGKMIAIAQGDKAKLKPEIDEGLHFLKEKSIITYRRFNSTYRIWEGSDVDIDERVAEGERKFRGRINLASSIQEYLETQPMIAFRHSFKSGALRYFSICYLDDPGNVKDGLKPDAEAAGMILVCLSATEKDLQTFLDLAASLQIEQHNLILAIPQQIGELRSAVEELVALRWAWENTPELRDDRVARREIVIRVTDAEHFLRYHLKKLLDPREEPLGSNCTWYWKGQVQDIRSRRDISQLLSTICDSVYDKSPWIRNELISRRNLSTTASSARRKLIERMLTFPSLPNLGIEGYPPERSMYESVLKATGLHIEVSVDNWMFTDPPKGKHHGLAPIWSWLQDVIFDSDSQSKPLDELFRLLSEAPYGLMDGVAPVLLCALMMAHPDEITLYREGTFIPESGIADFEMLMRRPELFAVGGSRLEGIRSAIVERLAKSLGTKPAFIPVVRAMFRMVRGLPDFSWKTKRLSIKTLKLRDAFQNAKSPERFLFNELPEALEFEFFPNSKSERSYIEAFFAALNESLTEWSTIANSANENAKSILLSACGVEPSDSGWQRLKEIAAKLEARENDPIILQFLRRILQANDDPEGFATVLALVANRPPANWLDSDVERFPGLAKALGEPIKRAMRRAGLTGEAQDALAILTTNQREIAKTIAQDLAKKLNPLQHQVKPEIMKAALLLLIDELMKNTGDKK